MSPSRRGRPSGPTGPVVGRALRLLETFSDKQPALTLSDIARRADMPLPTVHRLVRHLHAWGALERDDNGMYTVGIRLWEVASLAPRGPGLRARALPFMEDLSRMTGENVQLAIRDGTELVFVERIAGSGAVPVLSRAGGRFTLTVTGVGLVLLAHAPEEVQAAVLACPVNRLSRYTITDPEQLRRLLARIRTTGIAVSDRQISLDALSVAAPIRDGHGRVVAALSLVVDRARRSPSTLAPLIRSTTQSISAAIQAAPAESGGPPRTSSGR